MSHPPFQLPSYKEEDKFKLPSYEPAAIQPSTHTVEKEGFWSHIGNSIEYLHRAINGRGTDYAAKVANMVAPGAGDIIYKMEPDADQVRVADLNFNRSLGDIAASLGNGFLNTAKNAYEIVTNPIETISSAGDIAAEQIKSEGAGNFLGGMVKGVATSIVDMPVLAMEAITGTINNKGDIVPATKEQQDAALRETIGAIAATFVGGKTLNLVKPVEAELLGINKLSPIGKMGRAALPGATSGMAAGTVFGMVSTADKKADEQLAAMASSALAFGTIGGLFGSFGTKELKRKGIEAELGKLSEELRIKNEKLGEIRDRSNLSVEELAATRGVQITPSDAAIDITNKTKSFLTSTDAISALVEANKDKQLILESLPNEVVGKLMEKYNPSSRQAPGMFVLDPKLETIIKDTKIDLKLGDKGAKINLNVIDKFDRAALLSEKNKALLEGLKDATGLTDAEIKSHRDYLKSELDKLAADPSKMRQVPASEITAQVNKLASDFQQKVDNTPVGGAVKDVKGNDWIKVPNGLTNGKEVKPLNNLTYRALSDNIPGRQWDINLGKQNFSPEFGRELIGNRVYKGPNGETLLSPALPKSVSEVFEQTGYLPYEVVIGASGKPYFVNGAIKVEGKSGGTQYVKATNIETGKLSRLEPKNIRRLPGGTQSEFYKLENGEQFARMGVLNRESYYDLLYEKFSKDLGMDEVPKENYGTILARYAKQIGMTNPNDVRDMGNSFMSRMMKDVLKDNEPLKKAYENSIKRYDEYHESVSKDLMTNVNRTLNQQNVALFPRGGGVYELMDSESNNSLGMVKSFDEVLDYANKSRQANGMELDGGITQAQPFQGTALTDTYVVEGPAKWASVFSNWLNSGGGAKHFASQRPAMAEMNLKVPGMYDHFHALQQIQRGQYTLANSPELRKSIDLSNRAIESSTSLSGADRATIGDYTSGMSSKDIISKYNPDAALAKTVANVGYGKVVDFMHKVWEMSNFDKNKLDKSLQRAMKLDTYPAEVRVTAEKIFKQMDGSNRLAGTLALAKNIEFGEPKSVQLSPAQSVATKRLVEYYNNIPGLSDPIFATTSWSQLAEITGHNPYQGYGPEFLREINKHSITPSGQAINDPFLSVHVNRISGLRSAKLMSSDNAYYDGDLAKISFNDGVKKAREFLKMLYPKKGDLPEDLAWKREIAPYREYLRQHISDVVGVPDHSAALGKAAEGAFLEMFPDAKSTPDGLWALNAATYSALLGGAPIFAVRDWFNGVQNVFINSGSKAAMKVAGGSVSREYVEGLMANGELNVQGLEMLQPHETVLDAMGRISKVGKGVTKLADIVTKYNGQQLMHMQLSGGLYKYYYETVGQLSGKMLKGEKSKIEAYTELMIQKLPPTEQMKFDDLISAGKTEQAAKFLARVNVDRFNITYGMNNAPQGWRNNFGRLAGGFGQWAVHQVNTSIDQYGRGTRRQILESWARGTVSNAAIYSAGKALGLNLSGWMLNPISLPQGSPLLQGIIGVTKDGQDAMNLDPDVSKKGKRALMNMIPGYMGNEEFGTGNWDHIYLPMSGMVENIATFSQMDDFGPLGAGFELLGGSTLKKDVSPLQEAMGNRPVFRGKYLPNK